MSAADDLLARQRAAFLREARPDAAARRAALAAGSPAARESQFVVYPDAGHAFHADYRASYVEAAARDHLLRMQGQHSDEQQTYGDARVRHGSATT